MDWYWVMPMDIIWRMTICIMMASLNIIISFPSKTGMGACHCVSVTSEAIAWDPTYTVSPRLKPNSISVVRKGRK